MSDFETVKARADIVDVIGQYTTLQRSGRNFKACCPFHQEKTPSFHVDPARQTWHCFGACNTGGDVIRFIEKRENLSGPVEALKVLAERLGIELTRRERRPDEPANARLIEANEAAAQYFHSLLLNASAAEGARVYVEKRQLDADTVRAFQLGYALDSFDALREHLFGRGFSVEEQVAAGVLSENENGRRYDRFRDRLMFPIRDERGRVIGFGGRVLGDGLPKYLNSPQTALFDKSNTLYALDRAKDAIRAANAAVVVEGYMDAIAAHQHGITNVIATLGTALTERHVALLKRYTRDVVLAMDADAAGIEAALRGEELVRKTGEAEGDGPAQVVVDWRNLVRVQAGAPVRVRVFTVPRGKDPDEAIRADPSAFRALTERAVPPFEFRLVHELAKIDRGDPRERLALADRMLPLIAVVADRAMQAQYLSRLSQATAIPEDVLAARLNGPREDRGRGGGAMSMRERVGRRAAGPSAEEPLPEEPPPDENGPTEPVRPRRLPGPSSKPESTLLRVLFSFGALRETGLALEDELFTDPANRALFLAWKLSPMDTFADTLDDQERAHYSRVLAERLPPWDEAAAARALEDIAARLRQARLTDRARMVAVAHREAEAGADKMAATARAMAAMNDGSALGDDAESEVAARFLQAADLAQDRLSREVALRTHGTRVT
ncbi:MAG: DNA primase [Chloroflexi bacterium]|nr:DNA primase [Chloroflexota bacterium]